MGARLRMAFNCCGSKDEEKLPRESLPQPAKESLGNTTSHVEHHPAAPARSNAKWFCGQPMAISQQAPAPAPAVRAPEPQEEVFHEAVQHEAIEHLTSHKVDLSNTDSMMAIDTLIGMKKGLWEKYDKDKYDKKDGILSRKEAGKMLDKFMLGNFLKTFINDLPLIPADKAKLLKSKPSKQTKEELVTLFLSKMDANSDGVVEEHEFMEGIDCALKAVLHQLSILYFKKEIDERSLWK